MFLRKIAIVSSAIALAVQSWFAAGVQAQIIKPLGSATATGGEVPMSINNQGVIVGYSPDGVGGTLPTIWQPAGGYAPHVLPLIGGMPIGAANAINSGGLVTGYVQSEDQEAYTAVTWKPSSGGFAVSSLPIPAGMTNTDAYGVNASGQVVGYGTDADDNMTALTWIADAEGTYPSATILQHPAHQSQSAATAINNRGDIVGLTVGVEIIDGFPEMVYTGAGWMKSPGGYGTSQEIITAFGPGIPSAFNDNGLGTGGIYGKPMALAYFEGDFYGFDLNVPVDSEGAGNWINASDVIGGTVKDLDTPVTGFEAVIWLPTENFWEYVNLDQWLDQNYPEIGAHWTLLEVTSLNDTGLAVGRGLYYPDGDGFSAALDPVETSFVMDISSLTGVPEPSGVAAVAGLAMLAARRERRTRRVVK